ncbi:MAG: hypothetical protein ACLU3I_07605 [Acutalibacteraceae bacterium]
MQNEKYLELDALAAPNGYVVPPTKEDLAYVVHFRKTCQRYQIDFAKADPDERDFRDPYGRENIFTEACLIL